MASRARRAAGSTGPGQAARDAGCAAKCDAGVPVYGVVLTLRGVGTPCNGSTFFRWNLPLPSVAERRPSAGCGTWPPVASKWAEVAGGVWQRARVASPSAAGRGRERVVRRCADVCGAEGSREWLRASESVGVTACRGALVVADGVLGVAGCMPQQASCGGKACLCARPTHC